MNPSTLCTLLVFVLLWDVGPLLATSCQPPSRTAPTAQEFFPFAFRYREQIRQNCSISGGRRCAHSGQPPSPSPVGRPATAPTSQRVTPGHFSRLMPLRC